MGRWNCLVQTPSNNLRWVEVEAINHTDAVAQCEQQYAGICKSCYYLGTANSNSSSSYSSNRSGSSTSSVDEKTIGFLFLLVVGFWLFDIVIKFIIGNWIWFLGAGLILSVLIIIGMCSDD